MIAPSKTNPMDSQLNDLLEEVETATSAWSGPSSFVVLAAMGFEVARHARGHRIRYPGDRWQALPSIMHDWDDAVRVLKRALPDANCYGVEVSPRQTSAYVSRNCVASGQWLHEGCGPNEPSALTAALLRALIGRSQHGTAAPVGKVPGDPQ